MISIYKPNSKNTGHSMSVSYSSMESSQKDGRTVSSKDACFFITMVKQSSWNQEKRVGNFKQDMKDPAKATTIKINLFEAGGLINSFERIQNFDVFHSTPAGNSSISLTVNDVKAPKPNGQTKFFYFSIGKGSDLKFSIPLNMEEAVVIRDFLKFGLTCAFRSSISLQNTNKEEFKNGRR